MYFQKMQFLGVFRPFLQRSLPKVSFIAVFITMNVAPERIDADHEKNIDIISKLDKMDNQIAEVNQKLTSVQIQVNQINQNIRIEFNTLMEQVTQIQTKVIEIHTYSTPAGLPGREPVRGEPGRLCTIL